MKHQVYLKSGITVLLIVAVTLSVPVHAQEMTVQEVRLDDLMSEAFQTNPAIIAAKANWFAAKKRIAQSWALQDPMVGFDVMGAHTETRVGPQEHRFVLSQHIPFPLKLWKKRQAAKSGADIYYQKYVAVTRDVMNQLKYAYYDLYLADASIRAIEEIHQLLKKFESVAQARYAKLSGGQRDVAKAQAEVSLTLEQLFRLRQRRESIIAFMNALLNRDPMTPMGQTVRPQLIEDKTPLLEWANHAEVNREAIKEMEAMVEQSRAKKSLAKMAYLPDVTVGFTYTWVGDGTSLHPDDGMDSWMIPLRFTLPIWQNRIIPEIQEAQQQVEAAEANLTKTKNETFYQVKDAYLRFDTASRIAILYESAIIPQAKLALSSDQAGYESGKTEFLDLLDSERIFLNAKLTEIKVTTEALKSYADLLRASGMDVMGGEG